MPCQCVQIGEVRAIVCTSGRPVRHCACGAVATLQCDWKMGGAKRNGQPRTCDAHICAKCAQEVGPDKHLCASHQRAYAAWLAERPARRAEPGA